MSALLTIVVEVPDSIDPALADPWETADELLHDDLEGFEAGAPFTWPTIGQSGRFVSAEWTP